MTLIFLPILFCFLWSAGFFIVFQYRPDAFSLIFYMIGMIAACFCCFFLERRKRRQMADRILKILEGTTTSLSKDDELSVSERKIMLRLKDTETREARIAEAHRSIAGLVSDIAHQCKTPLSSLLLHTELLPDSDCAAVIRSQAEKLSFLLESLTKLSKCESGLISENLHPAKNDVRDLICRAVSDVHASAEAKNIRITANLPQEPEAEELQAVFDPRWTAEALFNLLDNAVKYTPPGGSIDIRTTVYDMFLRIDVTDTGCGIPEDDLPNVWKRFWRGKNSGEKGVGIGLYLTSRIVNGQGGRVSAASEAGKGSTFTMFLPKA